MLGHGSRVYPRSALSTHKSAIADLCVRDATLRVAMDTAVVMNPATASVPLTYDPFKDFATITLTAKNTSLLTVRAEGPAGVKELIAKGRANPGKMNYGAGIITTRLAGYLFARSAGFEGQLIPYKGSSEVVQGVLSGSVEFIVDGVAE